MSDAKAQTLRDQLAVEKDLLRWECPADWVPADDTKDVEPRTGIQCQPDAMEALQFGLESHGRCQHVYLRGVQGAGRLQLVADLVESRRPSPGPSTEYAYVCNFSEPQRPKLLKLPAGEGRTFRRLMREFAHYVRDELPNSLRSDAIRMRQEALDRQQKEEMDGLTGSFQEALTEAGLELVSVKQEEVPTAVPAIFPVIDGQPVAPEDFEEKHERGEISDEQYDEYTRSVSVFQKRLTEVTAGAAQIVRRISERKKEIVSEPAKTLLRQAIEPIMETFPAEDVRLWLGDVVDDVMDNRFDGSTLRTFDAETVYGVNLLSPRQLYGSRPVEVENHPSLANLLGSVDPSPRTADPVHFEQHMLIHAGSLLRSDGGYLIVDARQLIADDAAWRVLLRTLSSGKLEITPPELQRGGMKPLIKPEPIPIQVRIILVGDLKTYKRLDQSETDFSDLFKVMVDVESTIDRDEGGVWCYAGAIARLARTEGLPHFDRSAVQRLVEHGSRLADKPRQLTSRYDMIDDVAREAAYVANRRQASLVQGRDVMEALRRAVRRSDSPSRRYRYLLENGTFNVQTRGEVAGQINGLAVMRAAQISYGLPARLTATVGPGTAGIVDIENEAALGGKIHTKGFHILGGLLRHLLQTDHPLVFSASIAFEQSYGNIDGDSASGAEACCILSALSGDPIDQGVAMTGAIDQRGFIQAVGGINDKIEGFFDICSDSGLTGRQGVIIPRSTLGDLMLRPDVVEACKAEQFRVFAIERIEEALELLTGEVAGTRDANGELPPDSVLGRAARRTRKLWKQSTRRAGVQTAPARSEAEQDVVPAVLQD